MLLHHVGNDIINGCNCSHPLQPFLPIADKVRLKRRGDIKNINLPFLQILLQNGTHDFLTGFLPQQDILGTGVNEVLRQIDHTGQLIGQMKILVNPIEEEVLIVRILPDHVQKLAKYIVSDSTVFAHRAENGRCIKCNSHLAAPPNAVWSMKMELMPVNAYSS